jgi:hypothetical protein
MTMKDVLALLPPAERRFLRRRLRQLAARNAEALDLVGQALDQAERAQIHCRFAELRLKAHSAMCKRIHQPKRGWSKRRAEDLEMLRLHHEEGVQLKELRERFGRPSAQSIAMAFWRLRRRQREA